MGKWCHSQQFLLFLREGCSIWLSNKLEWWEQERNSGTGLVNKPIKSNGSEQGRYQPFISSVYVIWEQRKIAPEGWAAVSSKSDGKPIPDPEKIH